MNKIITLLLICFSLYSQAQTYFYPTSTTVTDTNLYQCNKFNILFTGSYSDGCGYQPYSTGDSIKVIGTTIFAYNTTRNLACDSGVMCATVIINASFNKNFTCPSAPNGYYLLKAINQNVCFNNISADTTLVGTVLINAGASNPILSNNASGTLSIGSAITYSFFTSGTNYTAYWYKNNVLANTSTTNTWNTTLSTNADTLWAKVNFELDTDCIVSTISNTNIVKTTPNSINNTASNKFSWAYNNNNRVLITDYTKPLQCNIYNLNGSKVFATIVESKVSLPFLPNGMYIIEFNDEKINYTGKILIENY
jgi:hypothetical protein